MNTIFQIMGITDGKLAFIQIISKRQASIEAMMT